MLVYYDISRICKRILRSTGSGIDYVDLEYARFFLKNNGRFAFCIKGYFFEINKSRVESIVKSISHNWKYGGILKFKLADLLHLQFLKLYGNFLKLLDFNKNSHLNTRNEFFTYINTSHHNLEYLKNLKKDFLGNVKIVTFIHDILPITHPHFYDPKTISQSSLRIECAIHNSDILLTSSDYNLKSIKSVFPVLKNEITKINLGSRILSQENLTGGIVPEKPFFVMIGTIEPRKNHEFIIDLWIELIKSFGEPPKLIIIGKLGWCCESFIAKFKSLKKDYRKYIICEHNVPDSIISAYLQSSIGMLSPSHVEGWGLNISEAKQFGKYVIANKIESYLEQEYEKMIFPDTLTISAWLTSLIKLINKRKNRETFQADNSNAEIFNWNSHFEVLELIIESLHDNKECM